jgi:SpoVK/Ycf46/Vps4 family AAA+-type ATPase
MTKADPLHDLELLLRSRYGLIVIDTAEEDRAETIVRLAADRVSLPLFHWSRSKGLRRDGATNAVYGTTDPTQALAHVASAHINALYFLRGPETLLAEPLLVDRLREVVGELGTKHGAVVFAGSALELPEALRRLSATVSLPKPDVEEFRGLIGRLERDLRQRMKVEIALAPADVSRLLANLKGLTLLEAEKILTRAIVEDGRLAPDDVDEVIAYKKEIVEREGVLEYYPVEETLADIADLAGLKAWLAKRTQFITSPEQAAKFGLSFPKGVLLVGVPGCGKSLCARAVAMEWTLPLLKLDPGRLYNKFMGESEKNFRRAMDTAERLAPCVLFIDELEKAFASGGSEDGGVSQRVLGTFLSWMQDRKGDVFTVATANDVSRLPPEFLRKGRFDEIFFVDLPNDDSRRAILAIHLKKRGQDSARFDLPALTAATDGFSGAEIEQAIVSALYTAFAARHDLNTALLQQEIAATRPLSQVMAERVQALREWARERTVSANEVQAGVTL